jgi:phage terminase Nu1 subunit (DNA packaging protein)
MANEIKLDKMCPEVYGISVRRYQQLAKEGLVPPSENGFIDFVASTKALIAYYQKLLQGKGSITLVEENARLTKIKADMAYLDYEKRRGQLLERNEVVRAWSTMIGAAKTKLLAIGVKVTPVLDGLTRAERKERIDEIVHESLEDLAEMTSDELKKAVVSPEHVSAAAGKETPVKKAVKKQKAKDRNIKKKEKKLCALCNKKEIDRRATYCKACAALQREQEKKKRVPAEGCNVKE